MSFRQTKNYKICEVVNKLLLCLFQANGDASLGKYAAGSVSGTGATAGLFVANHAY